MWKCRWRREQWGRGRWGRGGSGGGSGEGAGGLTGRRDLLFPATTHTFEVHDMPLFPLSNLMTLDDFAVCPFLPGGPSGFSSTPFPSQSR